MAVALTTRQDLHRLPAMSRAIKIALIGCGTVGGATATILLNDRALIAERSGIDIEIGAIYTRDFAHARELGIPESLFETDLERILADPEIEVVVELIGGTTDARTIIKRAVAAGKHVVTANKALLAHHGEELWAAARTYGVTIGFEASTGGGIPIIRAIIDGLMVNRIDAIYGIVNGTSNYILTRMTQEGTTYDDALSDAQADGLAEADPSLDVQGTDSAHKLAIMASLAFGLKVDFDTIPVSGIDTLESIDVKFGQDLGYVVKLLAVAHRTHEGITLWVRPAFISREHPLAWVSGPFNAVSAYGHATGHTLYYGRGAGGHPTASAVISDISAIALGTLPAIFNNTGYWQDKNLDTRQINVEETNSRFYIRIMAKDQPGVLAEIARIFGIHEISIASMLQPETTEDGEDTLVPIVITTHSCKERDLRAALKAIDSLTTTDNTSVSIPIAEEHPEKFGSDVTTSDSRRFENS